LNGLKKSLIQWASDPMAISANHIRAVLRSNGHRNGPFFFFNYSYYEYFILPNQNKAIGGAVKAVTIVVFFLILTAIVGRQETINVSLLNERNIHAY